MGAVNCATCEVAQDRTAVKASLQKSCLKKKASDEAEDGLGKFRDTLKKSFKNPKDAFKMLDRDGDASLDKDEFAEALVTAGKKAKWDKETQDFMSGLSGEIFSVMDEDGDGNLTFEEFKAALQRTLLIDMNPKEKKSKKVTSPSEPTSPTSPTSPASVGKDEKKRTRRSSSTISTTASDGEKEMPASQPNSPGVARQLRRKSTTTLAEDGATSPTSPGASEPASPDSNTDAKKPGRLSRRASSTDVDDANDPIIFLRGLLKKNFKDPKDAFKALDQDGDKALDVDEFCKMLIKIAKDNKWEKKSVTVLESVAKDIFTSMDANGDGNVTMDEFKGRLAAKA